VAERLFLRTYDLELEQARDYRIWAYRKAAWTVDEWSESVAEIYETQGEAGLRELPKVGGRIAKRIAGWLRDEVWGKE
jgi:DNA polymerase/3'-5' exonuclease PolX